MNIEEIKKLLKENQSEENWGHVQTDTEYIATLNQDVNLRICLTHKDPDPLTTVISIWYMSTLLLWTKTKNSYGNLLNKNDAETIKYLIERSQEFIN